MKKVRTNFMLMLFDHEKSFKPQSQINSLPASVWPDLDPN